MKRQKSLNHAAVVPFGQVFERPTNSLAKEAPLLNQKVGECAVPIFQPNAPLPARLLNRVGPVSKPRRRPNQTVVLRKDEPIRLQALEDHVCKSKQSGGPVEEFVSDWRSGMCLPSRC